MSKIPFRIYISNLNICIAVVKEKALGENVVSKRSVLHFRTDLFCVKCLHRFVKMKLKFTDILLLP